MYWVCHNSTHCCDNSTPSHIAVAPPPHPESTCRHRILLATHTHMPFPCIPQVALQPKIFCDKAGNTLSPCRTCGSAGLSLQLLIAKPSSSMASMWLSGRCRSAANAHSSMAVSRAVKRCSCAPAAASTAANQEPGGCSARLAWPHSTYTAQQE